MAARKLNVLVYSGNGTTVESVRHCLYTLRRLLGSNYAVIPVTGDMILKEPWVANCAAIVMPGGADLPYCRTLNGEGNRKIRQFVQNGGVYIGFCAGGYYGSRKCEFEVGNKQLEVIGDRELAFFPGTCRGCAFPGFVYHSEKGARPAELKVNKATLPSGNVPDIFRTYYNGGGCFVDAKKYESQGVKVLANYNEDIAVDGGDGKAAVVYCKVGNGAALLTGPHPEFATVNLDRSGDKPDFDNVVDILANDEKHCMDFVKACLEKLGLQVSDQQNVPSLSRIHLSSLEPTNTPELMQLIGEAITTEDGEEYIKGEHDTFHFVNPSTWKMSSLKDALIGKDQTGQVDGSAEEGVIDYNAIIKEVMVHKEDYPQSKQTPYFNHPAFYTNLKHYNQKEHKLDESDIEFGYHILYGEVVTSTNTLLEKNPSLLRHLPQGLTLTATVQVAGRGRGSNIWVSPAGSLMFSTVIRHPMSLMSHAPVVFIQYLAAMAVVLGIKNYDGHQYADLPIKLKWPNDIYCLDPAKAEEPLSPKSYTKIGGILVNSHYDSKNYISVVGIGLNTTNALPTTSLNALLTTLPNVKSKNLPPFTPEKLLSSILSQFQSLYHKFLSTGFSPELESLYYRDWLHMNQIVTLETHGGMRARIKGITRDFGLLVAEELGWEDRRTGKQWELQSDGNSFDFFRGLVRRKEM